jgi:hypothetical protein
VEFSLYDTIEAGTLEKLPGASFELTGQGFQIIGVDGRFFLLCTLTPPQHGLALPHHECCVLISPDSLEIIIDSARLSQSELVTKEIRPEWLKTDPIFEQAIGEQVIANIILGKIKHLMVFASAASADKTIYLGESTVCSVGRFGTGDGKRSTIGPMLQVKLPKHLWQYFGGHGGHVFSVGGDLIPTNSTEESLRLFRELWGNCLRPMQIRCYENDLLLAATNAKGESVVMYSTKNNRFVISGFNDPAWGWRSFDDEFTDDLFTVCASSLISREEAAKIIGSFLVTGQPVGLPGY